jgi:hypothetical protein
VLIAPHAISAGGSGNTAAAKKLAVKPSRFLISNLQGF